MIAELPHGYVIMYHVELVTVIGKGRDSRQERVLAIDRHLRDVSGGDTDPPL